MKKPIPTRRASLKQEKKVAQQLGGKVQPNSGATDYIKGDVVTDNMLIECKTVMKPQKTVSIKKEWFEKNELTKRQKLILQLKMFGFTNRAIAYKVGISERAVTDQLRKIRNKYLEVNERCLN